MSKNLKKKSPESSHSEQWSTDYELQIVDKSSQQVVRIIQDDIEKSLSEPLPETQELQIIHKATKKIVQTIRRDKGKPISFLGVPLTIQKNEEKEWDEIVSPLKDFSQNQILTLKNIVQDLGPSLEKTVLSSAIQKIIEQSSNEEVFAMPSHAVMFTLLAMFAGKPDRIPRKLLAKSHTEWSEEERIESEKFLNSILKKESVVSYRNGTEDTEDKYIAILSDNPKVEAQADITTTFFRNDLRFREESLAIYIKRTFGPEGLRHLLGLLIGLEENSRKGHFEWSVNEHLERLGYKKKMNGAYDSEVKKAASEIIIIFTSLFITARKKEGKKEVIQGEKLFSIEGFKKEMFDKVIIDERIRIRATDFWFKNAFEPKDGHSGKYTKLLKKIARENHREHPLTIFLAPLLAVFWRMNPEQKISVSNLMEWCDLDMGKYRYRSLESLESELNYMKQEGHLGSWTCNGEEIVLSDSKDPFNLSLTLTPPKWLDHEIQKIHAKKDFQRQLGNQKPTLITLEEIKDTLEKSKLSARQFSNKIGLTNAMLSYLLRGKRPITAEISEKIMKFRENQMSGQS
jgi:hypothetical protein